MDERTALYRLFGSDDALLYVGISCNPEQRFEQHARKQPWWPEVARREVANWFGDRKQALIAEAASIVGEKPRYNIHVPAPGGRFGFSPHMPGRPATGQTPVSNYRIPVDLVIAAKQKAKAEGRTLTDVVVAYLRRYVSTPPRNARAKPDAGSDQTAS